MQRCNVTVRLGGDLGNTVRKSGVSPAEIIILRHIHGGDDSVFEIQPTGMDKTPHADERERLNYTYKKEVVDHLFPGAVSPLPVSLKDIGIGRGEPEPEPEETVTEEDSEAPATEADPPAVEPFVSDGLEADDRELIDAVLTAKSKADLHQIAEENEVHLTEGKMDDMRRQIITSLFPNYKM